MPNTQISTPEQQACIHAACLLATFVSSMQAEADRMFEGDLSRLPPCWLARLDVFTDSLAEANAVRRQSLDDSEPQE
tara:strand:- start:235 stop:465 length:231 start_codon:yes stop_codon:yes gene_type:complete